MSRAARQDFAVRPDRTAHAGWTDRDRHADLFAEHGRLELSVGHVEHDPLAEADGVEVAAVFAQRDLREGAGLEIVHERLGHAGVRAFAQVLDAGDAGWDLPHSSPRFASLLDAVGDAAGERLDGQRRIDAAAGREQRAVADPQIRDVPAAAVGVDDAVARVVAHAAAAHQVAVSSTSSQTRLRAGRLSTARMKPCEWSIRRRSLSE